MVRFTARFDGKVLIPDHPVELPRGVPLDLTVETRADGSDADWARRLVGLGREVWEGIDPVEYQRSEREGWE